jgi:hypothetical protein
MMLPGVGADVKEMMKSRIEEVIDNTPGFLSTS